eukprot:6601335-Pyramimonas_sp.AAC.1
MERYEREKAGGGTTKRRREELEAMRLTSARTSAAQGTSVQHAGGGKRTIYSAEELTISRRQRRQGPTPIAFQRVVHRGQRGKREEEKGAGRASRARRLGGHRPSASAKSDNRGVPRTQCRG